MKKIAFLFLFLTLLALKSSLAQGCGDSPKGEGAQVIGFIQPQFDYNFHGQDAKGNSLNTSTFKFNRARIGVTGAIPYDFEYYVMLETSPFISAGGNPYLLDAFVTYKRLGHWAKLSFGSFKSPISLELNTPCNALYTINRSKVVDDLTTPNRDIGFMVSGGSDSLTIFGIPTYNFLKYSFAYTNGTGLSIADKNRAKNIAGRIIISPWDFLSVGASYLSGNQRDADSLNINVDKRTRYGFDAEFKMKNLVVQAEYLYGSDDGAFTTGGGCGGGGVTYPGPITRAGYVVMAAYMFPMRLQPVLKYSSYDTDLKTDNDPVFDVNATTTFGLNYFFNDWTRLQINYCMNTEDILSVKNDILAVQMQIKIK